MASAEEALAAFRATVGEEEYQRITDEAEISRLANGRAPETNDDPEIERLLKNSE